MEPTLTYLSLGAGVQSSALYVLAAQRRLPGDCPTPTVAIFADTQDEPQYVYDYLGKLRDWGLENGGPPIDLVTHGCLSADVLDPMKGGRTRFVPIPVYSTGADRESQLRRQCTREYKLQPIEKHAKRLLGFGKGQRVKGQAHALIGISLDEVHRMRVSQTLWIANHYPLVSLGLRRSGCVRVVEEAGLPTPQKSACTYCPFKTPKDFRWLSQNHPADFERACRFDEAIRGMGKNADKGQLFVHRSLRPLREAVTDDSQLSLDFDAFGNDCLGLCGV